MLYSVINSPIGSLTVCGEDGKLCGLYFSTGDKARSADPQWQRDDQYFGDVKRQLGEYFDGSRQAFELDLEPQGTPFQQAVLKELQHIPFGETRSYKEVACAIGRPKAVRAVGAANGNNPIALIIPCHRVIGSNGKLTGFGGGLDAKRFLLDHEVRHRDSAE